jgi:hypothetical protein
MSDGPLASAGVASVRLGLLSMPVLLAALIADSRILFLIAGTMTAAAIAWCPTAWLVQALRRAWRTQRMIRSGGTGLLLLAVLGLHAFAQQDASQDALLNALVWGTYESLDPLHFAEDIRHEVADYVRRATQNCPMISPPPSGRQEMIQTAMLRSACRLTALSDRRDARQLAEGYAVGLQPCLDWEGRHDCPEREAKFADQYRPVHIDGPFSAFLPLLAAHRWLCAAEAYELEGRRAEAYLDRRWYEQRLGLALRSNSLMVRAAAERLSERGRCF